jgi:hypothetical protein
MTPPSDRPGMVSTAIDIGLVAVILACAGVLLFSAFQVVSGGVRAVTRWRRRRRAWLRGNGDGE